MMTTANAVLRRELEEARGVVKDLVDALLREWGME
jgi:hypothetical protein